jgi:hypothetical protein
VEDLTSARKGDIRSKLENTFQATIDERQFDSMLDQMIRENGKLLEVEFKQDELGTKTYPEGHTKPMLKFWYAVRTTRYEKGSHFLIVEVVPDGSSLAISSFAIVTFPSGIPSALK